MSTATEVDISDLTEFEFDTPCKSRKGCDQSAVALYSRSHSRNKGCWCDPVTLCQRHLVEDLRSFEDWLAPGGICAQCHKPIHGGIRTNTRIVRL